MRKNAFPRAAVMKKRFLCQRSPKLELNIFKSKYVLSEITGVWVTCDLLTILTKQRPMLGGFANDGVGSIARQVLQEG